MANQWFKFYGAEYLSDPKMDRLTVQERSCWITLLCMASQTEGKIRYLSVEGLLNKSGIHFDPYDSSEWDKALGVLKTFEQYEMINIHKNGTIEIKNWEKRQEHNLTVAERVAKSRAKRKNVTNDVTNVTLEENRIEENRVDKSREESKNTDLQKKPEKSKFGEFENVLLTEIEYKKLIDWMGEKNTSVLIEELSTGIESKGYKYKSHYATILNWARRKAQDYNKNKKPERKII